MSKFAFMLLVLYLCAAILLMTAAVLLFWGNPLSAIAAALVANVAREFANDSSEIIR